MAEEVQQKFCPSCYGGNPPDARMCMWCGNRFPSTEAPPGPLAPAQQKARHVPQRSQPAPQAPRTQQRPQVHLSSTRSLLRRFPWWVYLLVILCVCSGIIYAAGSKPEPRSIAGGRYDGIPPSILTALVATRIAEETTSRWASTPAPSPPTVAPNWPELEEGRVTRVVDGDTLDISIGGRVSRVRIIGVDTPETVDPNRPIMCYGKEASVETDRLVTLAEGRVLLEKDVSEMDRYRRLLRYVWLQQPGGWRMLNLELVKGGFAQVATFPSDVKYQELFLQAQREAREHNRGLWAACGTFGVAVATPTREDTAEPTHPFEPTEVPATPAITEDAAGSEVVIFYVYFDGQEPDREGDEYAVIKNTGGNPVDLKEYRLNAGDPYQDFNFPSFVLNPGAAVRVYTNRSIKGSFSFGIGRAIWNNRGDCGHLYNPSGKQVSEYCYPISK